MTLSIVTKATGIDSRMIETLIGMIIMMMIVIMVDMKEAHQKDVAIGHHSKLMRMMHMTTGHHLNKDKVTLESPAIREEDRTIRKVSSVIHVESLVTWLLNAQKPYAVNAARRGISKGHVQIKNYMCKNLDKPLCHTYERFVLNKCIGTWCILKIK